MCESKMSESGKGRKRLPEIDRVRGLAMCVVVVGHIFALVNGSKPEMGLGSAIRFLSVFEMPIFFVISGYLFYKHHEPVFLGFVKKRIKGLMVPYFIFSALNMLFFIFLEPAEQMSLTDMSVTTFTFYGISVLWFFPTLLIGESIWWMLYHKLKMGYGMFVSMLLMVMVGVLYKYVQPIEGSVWTSSLLFAILGKLCIVLLRGIVCQFFIGVGHCFGYVEAKLQSRRIWNVIMWTALFIGLFATCFVPAVNLRDLVWGKTGLWCLSAAMVSTGLIFFFQKTLTLPIRLLDVIGKNSLVIMCTHLDFKIPIYCMMCAEQLVAISSRAKNYIYWGTLFLTFVVIEGILIVGWNLIRRKRVV